jgi:hypothetical protein
MLSGIIWGYGLCRRLGKAWKRIEKIPGAKAFMGGSMGAHTGFFNFHMARRSAGDREEPNPLYPAAAIMFDVGIIVGAHKTATISNAIQGKLSKLLESAMEGHDFDMKDWLGGMGYSTTPRPTILITCGISNARLQEYRRWLPQN